jgi:hypothetical protein
MARTNIFDPLFRTVARKRTFIYWQTVPLHRLTFLLLALFCLFGMIGFIVDLFALGQKPVLTVIIWTIFTGAMAVTYLLIAIRASRFLLFGGCRSSWGLTVNWVWNPSTARVASESVC